MGGKKWSKDLRVTQSTEEKTEDEVCAERGHPALRAGPRWGRARGLEPEEQPWFARSPRQDASAQGHSGPQAQPAHIICD